MPNTASAKKKMRQARKRTLRNRLVKSKIKAAIKKFNEALKLQDVENIKSALIGAVKALDKAASKGVIHKNAAARKKSRLYKKLKEHSIAI
ncbi:30S ribosomal protein S20 [Thermosediminibacter oceani]|uniref:Small ribosomal subunit protein bS20 n=1 Tax=Thermosediminibacter oceani (strain ATCC BAA-1034 / DSM 16646 / JW/IW-1228P) TaxID=555079 RepID=D9S2N3_THEOJ|nr:30S ribosomal protein S20 [Thermosediminibacter oceani]ADL07660.1 SSU ribosomal protein S20P [Thermosediminibacter oceani DSM 16646]